MQIYFLIYPKHKARWNLIKTSLMLYNDDFLKEIQVNKDFANDEREPKLLQISTVIALSISVEHIPRVYQIKKKKNLLNPLEPF